jgi:hypothetical protein
VKKLLCTAPFTIDAEALAAGLLELFDDEERVVLRFGMLPALKMESVERMLREKFTENCTGPSDGDQFSAWTNNPGERRVVEFSMKKLVSEAMHEISVALYKIGDLVV